MSDIRVYRDRRARAALLVLCPNSLVCAATGCGKGVVMSTPLPRLRVNACQYYIAEY